MIGGPQRRFGRRGIALFGDEGFIVGAIVPELERPGLAGGDGVGLRRQRIVIHFDGLDRILALIDALGDDHGDDMAHMQDPVAGQGRARRPEAGRSIAPLGRWIAGNGADPVRLPFGAGQNRNDTRHGVRGLRVDTTDLRMGMGRAQKHRRAFAWQRYIVGEAAFAHEKAWRFDLGYRLTDCITGHDASFLGWWKSLLWF